MNIRCTIVVKLGVQYTLFKVALINCFIYMLINLTLMLCKNRMSSRKYFRELYAHLPAIQVVGAATNKSANLVLTRSQLSNSSHLDLKS